MSERYIAKYCLVLQDFRVFDTESRMYMPGSHDTWAKAQTVACRLNYPPQEPAPAAPCRDCARKAKQYEFVLEVIRMRTDDEFARRLADDALNFGGEGEAEHAA